jgi:hypothetical protein
MNDTFQTLMISSQSDGWSLNGETKGVTRKRICRFPLAYEAVLVDRTIPSSPTDSDYSLAMLEMRLLIAYFVWHFDAELYRKEEPYFEDRFVARRGPLEVRVKPIRESN